MLAPKLTSPPSGSIVSIEELRRHVVVDFDGDDEVLVALEQAATGKLDGPTGVLNRAIREQAVEQCYSYFARELTIPYGPPNAISSIQYHDLENTLQTLPDGRLLQRDGLGLIVFDEELPATYSRPDAVKVTYTAGGAEIDSRIKLAVKMMVYDWYENRGSTSDKQADMISGPVKSLMAPFKRIRL